jgi:predicted Fe-S protein YdhL (DUF1289 family)
MDPGTGWCLGCGRTTDEIGDWFFATDRQKQAILATLPVRRSLLRDRRR